MTVIVRIFNQCIENLKNLQKFFYYKSKTRDNIFINIGVVLIFDKSSIAVSP